MKRLRKILLFLLALLSLPVVGYAQNMGSTPLSSSALQYLYQPTRRWTGGKFVKTSPLSADRFYVALESGAYQNWRYDEPLGSENWGIRSSLRVGYQLAPVHNIEISAGWNQSMLYDDHITVGLSYLFNATSYASQLEIPKRFELLLATGADVEFTESVAVVANAGVRMKYNISPTVGVYLQPNLSMVVHSPYGSQYAMRDVRSALYFGVTINPNRFMSSLNCAFALKTNMLYNAATITNVEVEVPIGERYSVAAEWVFPWWTEDNGLEDSARNRTQMLNANIEGKYWFGDREQRATMTGWFAGAYVGGGLYDFERDAEGYQGEFYVAVGASGGYAHKLNRRGSLRMEYSLGVGYLVTDYSYYMSSFGNDDAWHPIISEKGTFYWVGPTKAKVSLVWFFNQRKR